MRRTLQEQLQLFPLFLWLLPFFFIHTGYNELFGLLPISLALKNLIILGLGILLILLLTCIFVIYAKLPFILLLYHYRFFSLDIFMIS
jgi:hypothetical protein